MKIRYQLTKDMLARTLQFMEDHPVTPLIPRAAVLRAKVASLLDSYTELSGTQMHGRGGYRAGAQERRLLAQALRTMLVDMAATARGLDPMYPGMGEQFRLGRQTDSFQKLLATARAFLMALETASVRQLFTDRAFPADIDARLAAKIAALTAATGRKDSGLQSQKQGTVGMEALSREVTVTMRELRALMVTHLREADPILLEVWNAAARIYRRSAAVKPATVANMTESKSGERIQTAVPTRTAEVRSGMTENVSGMSAVDAPMDALPEGSCGSDHEHGAKNSVVPAGEGGIPRFTSGSR